MIKLVNILGISLEFQRIEECSSLMLTISAKYTLSSTKNVCCAKWISCLYCACVTVYIWELYSKVGIYTWKTNTVRQPALGAYIVSFLNYLLESFNTFVLWYVVLSEVISLTLSLWSLVECQIIRCVISTSDSPFLCCNCFTFVHFKNLYKIFVSRTLFHYEVREKISNFIPYISCYMFCLSWAIFLSLSWHILKKKKIVKI